MQTSSCNRCGRIVEANDHDGGKVFYNCPCGRSWAGRAYYGRETNIDRGGHAGLGALAGLALGGVGTLLLGGLIGNFIRKEEALVSECIVCGGEGHPTGFKGNRAGFQCSECYRTWVERM
jgi:hypothetical protein